MRPVLISIAVLTTVLLIPACKSEWVQRTVNPVQYWNTRANRLEELVTFYQDGIRSCRLELERLRRAREIEVVLERLKGMPSVEDPGLEWKIAVDLCEMRRSLLELTSRDLEGARAEIDRAKNR